MAKKDTPTSFKNPAQIGGKVFDFQLGEHRSGANWIDAKPIFRQVFPLEGLLNNDILLAAGIVDIMIQAYGYGLFGAGIFREIGEEGGANFLTVDQIIADGSIIFRRTAVQPAGTFAVLEYTKL